MRKLVTWPLTVLGLMAATAIAADSFEKVKSQFANATCVHIEFISIIDSDIFNTVDSIYGVADIAQDGRFYVRIGAEEYLYDNQNLYTYSVHTNQVIIDQPLNNLFAGSEIAMITRMNEYYDTETIQTDASYRLYKKRAEDTGLPDTVTVQLQEDTGQIAWLRYLDINRDPNTILMRHQRVSDDCDSSLFIPSFPDSAERVRL